MIAALLLSAAVPSALDAEQLFARDAQRIGQWSAFRKWAHRDAVMFTPQAVWAHEFLSGRKDPPGTVRWAAANSWVSCDGRTAINRGPAQTPTGKTYGHFTTVWLRDKGAWKWTYDGGDALSAPRALPKQAKVERASCSGLGKIRQEYREEAKPTARIAGKPPADAGQGRSADGTLIYEWKVAASGERHFEAKLWNGRDYRTILDQRIIPPAR